MKLDLGSLQSFSATLLTLSDVARSAPPERLIHDALLALRPLVPFRSAWWGECSDMEQVPPTPRNWLHGRINLSATFAQEWNRLAGGDTFAMGSMRNLGKVQRFSGHGDPDPAVSSFSRRHALDHAMAITLELPGSGLMFFAALYRGELGPAFEDGEAALFTEFFSHLAYHWRMRVHELLLGANPRNSDAFGLSDRNGNLLYLGARLGDLLHECHPTWKGSMLPPELAAMVAHAPRATAIGAHQLTLQPCGELVTLTLERSGRAARLPPRERSVAMLYAKGHSYKEIARLLELSPATVRTYLRSVYVHLGVRNKIELSGALGPADRAHQ